MPLIVYLVLAGALMGLPVVLFARYMAKYTNADEPYGNRGFGFFFRGLGSVAGKDQPERPDRHDRSHPVN